jgi:signal transduction histidine kinase
MFKKGLVVIAVPFLFQILFILALWNSQTHSAEAQRLALHTKEVIGQAEAVARHLAGVQSSARGLVLTHDPSLSDEFVRLAQRLPGSLRMLRDLVDDNPAQGARVDRIEAKALAALARYEEVRQLSDQGDWPAAADRVRDAAVAGVIDGVRGEIDRLLAEEDRLFALRDRQLERARARQYGAIAAGAAVSVLAAVLTVLAFSRGFARRVEALGENARRLSEGKPLAEPMTGDDELGRLDAAFHDMAAALAERDRENEMFIYSVSHDLRSPLVNLQGFSKELAMSCDDLRQALAPVDLPDATRRKVAALLDYDMKDAVQFIQTAVTRLSSIIDALLRLSRAGRVEYRMQPVDVAGVVARVVDSLRGTAAQRGAAVVVGDLPPAWADPTALEQVFANLVGNALNYLDPTRPGRVEVGAEQGRDGEALRTYYVRDNGLGIPRAYQDKLFLAFQRLHPGVAAGEGVGLSLVRRVVERHGGSVRFESEEGQGATFYVSFPAPPGDGSWHEAAESAHVLGTRPLDPVGVAEEG